MHTIEVDTDVFRELSLLRVSEDISFNHVLRDILGLDCNKETENAGSDDCNPPWVTENVVFPHGALFRGRYKGCVYLARVENGALMLKGKKFLSPTAAAFSITKKSSLDGWLFWECKPLKRGPWISISKFKNEPQ